MRVGASQRLAISRKRSTTGSVISSIVGSAADPRGRMTGVAGRTVRAALLAAEPGRRKLDDGAHRDRDERHRRGEEDQQVPEAGHGFRRRRSGGVIGRRERGPHRHRVLLLRLRRRRVFRVGAARRRRIAIGRTGWAGNGGPGRGELGRGHGARRRGARVHGARVGRDHGRRFGGHLLVRSQFARTWRGRGVARCSANALGATCSAGAVRTACSTGAARATFWFTGPRYQHRRPLGRSRR